MTYTLLVWEEIPEATQLYLIPNEEADKYRNFLEQAHNKFINCDSVNDGMEFLAMALSEQDSGNVGFEKYHGVLVPYLRDHRAQPITGETITAVYVSGFVL